MVLLQGVEHESWRPREIQHPQLQQARLYVQLRDESFSVFGLEGGSRSRWLAPSVYRHQLLQESGP